MFWGANRSAGGTVIDPLDVLYLEHAIASYDKSVYLDAMHGRHSWELRLDLGTLAFSEPHGVREEYAVQFLGTASTSRRTWLWAWANEAVFPQKSALVCAQELAALDKHGQLPELARPETSLIRSNSTIALDTMLAAVASGICRAGAHFRAPYDDGALLMLIKDARFKRPVQRPLARIVRIVPMYFARYQVKDALSAFMSYVSFYRLQPVAEAHDTGTRVTVAPRSEPTAIQLEQRKLVAEFGRDQQFLRIDWLG